ncbi:MAG: RNA-binding transcriptional accessory protein [Bacteroidales bacterium]|nr:RNA-binding transcriptional accessory protein [Bacteroidales bacterium]
MDPSIHIKTIARKLQLHDWQVENTLRLLDDGATIPFISRYRKEVTGSLNEVQLAEIRDEYERLKELDKRREAIIKSVEEQEKMTPELLAKINAALTMSQLEDLYLPYRPKRKTRASVAREKGLEPLALWLLDQKPGDPVMEAEKYVADEVETVDAALAGARDIIAEMVSENELVRGSLRRLYERDAVITSRGVKGKEQEGAKFSDYFEWSEPLRRCPSHRLLAMRRGEDEGFLRLIIMPPEDQAVETIEKQLIKADNSAAVEVREAVTDCWNRLLAPSMETEFRKSSKEKADEEAIRVFAENLRQLLLAPPLGEKNVLGIDPGFRTGCKVVCLNRQGALLHDDVIYPHPPQNETARSVSKLLSLIERFETEAIAIGNGTASRETEQFVRTYLAADSGVKVFVVSEAGASVYSASKTARDEFPDHDVTVRGAVSIGRRLMDPLAELVKIDPKSIGVGQYQHDVDQARLQASLDEVVMSCVNAVGVEVNTASPHLLTYVSGIGPKMAQNIIDHRTENGPFRSRADLMKVKRMGEKAYEQAAGFLRIRDAANPLDASAVHPESYHIVEKMAVDVGCTVAELIRDETKRKMISIEKYVTPEAGLPTLKDIMQELARPGRDPRSALKEFTFADIHSIEDVKEGMVVPGIVTNITKFGAFVDIGVKQDGLVHVSQMADRYVDDPAKVVKLHQHITVRILNVDLARKRIQLSMKGVSSQQSAAGSQDRNLDALKNPRRG